MNLTMLDDRTGSQLNLIDPYALRYIFIDPEYESYHFEDKFRKQFSGLDLITSGEIGHPSNKYGYLKILSVTTKTTLHKDSS